MANPNAIGAYHEDDDDDTTPPRPALSLVPPPRAESSLFATSAEDDQKKRSFAENFLNLNRHNEELEAATGDEEDEDDTETSSGTKKKRGRVGRALRKLFKGSRPQSEPTIDTQPTVELKPFTNLHAENTPDVSHDENEPTIDDTSQPNSELPVTEDTPTREAIIQPGSNSEFADNDEPDQVYEATEPVIEEAVEEPALTPNGGGDLPPREPPVARVAELNPVTPPEHAVQPTVERHTETVRETGNAVGPALVAFLGAEILSRRRDRKIRKTARQQDTKITQLENQSRADQQSSKAREDTARQEKSEYRETITMLKKVENTEKSDSKITQPTVEVAPRAIPPIPAEKLTSAPQVERPPQPIIQRNNERPIKSTEKIEKQPIVPFKEAIIPPAIRESAKLPEQKTEKEQTSPPQFEQQKTDTVERRAENIQPDTSEKVMSLPFAPEVKNISKESDFEKRHEIKDDKQMKRSRLPTQDSMSTPNWLKEGTTVTTNLNPDDTNALYNSIEAPDDKNNADYSRSMQAGVITGVVTIAIGLIAYFVLRT